MGPYSSAQVTPHEASPTLVTRVMLKAGHSGWYLQSQNFGRLGWVDHLRSGVRDQPVQHGETPSLLKIQKLARRGGMHL